MRTLEIAFFAALGLAPTAAFAQVVPPPPPISGFEGATRPGIAVCYTGPGQANCPALGGGFAGSGIDTYFVPLSSLAYASTTDALAAGQRKARNVLSGGVAMATALDTIAPADGRQNRIGGGLSTFDDQSGLALTYTRRTDQWDAGLGLATSRYQSMAKATIGFSW
ncbi:hypothetical protein [Caulobacter endophyticus]|uniref:hypothetical protein n=1 Tax=Caulobacter endophyticus TaxID=2172652 RepID=UPI00240FFF3B|nr:hypothetical protein [Caulobacter endophyticus]MDG2527185.1 hypothetical protein [Caulobacter endophyticus]